MKPSLPVTPEPPRDNDYYEEIIEDLVQPEAENTTKQPKQRFYHRWTAFVAQYWKRASKKHRIAMAVVAVLLFAGIATGVAALLRSDPPPPEEPIVLKEEPEPEPEPTTVASPLTGMQVEPELAELPVTAVMVENSPEARPQSGLLGAGVVFEAKVEGGITRFMSLYQESQPDPIGPIRSIRRSFLDWQLGFDAALAHVGGEGAALNRIRRDNIRDLDQFRFPQAYWRSSNRFAPHNMYSNRKNLLEVHNSQGYTSSDFQGFARKEPKPAATPTARTINLNISRQLYNVRYEYDATANSYRRFLAGVPHVDEASNTQLQPDVVIAIVTDVSRDGIYTLYRTTGSGKAYIFQDGEVIEGAWEKPNARTNYRFGDANGLPIGLNPGQTWITMAASTGEVSYSP
jgi:hypothetical protein